MSKVDFQKLRRFSADIRIETVRSIGKFGYGHIGGAISIADVLAVLYGEVMNVDPKNPADPARDRFILSKGHTAPGLYAALALKGFFPMNWLDTLNQGGTLLPSHADARKVPGVDFSTGSLGQGASAALGIAMANAQLGRDAWTYCVVGDGEMNEGEIWEAAEVAYHFHTDHLMWFIDWNKKQLDGDIKEIMDPIDLEAKMRAFGWDARTVKGWDVEDIYNGIMAAKAVPGLPHVILLDTEKGLGINFAETAEINHYMTFGLPEAEDAIAEIERRLAAGTYPWEVKHD